MEATTIECHNAIDRVRYIILMLHLIVSFFVTVFEGLFVIDPQSTIRDRCETTVSAISDEPHVSLDIIF